jgi:hypothetical protein
MSAIDRAVTALARRQHGVVAAHQLRAAGIGRTAVHRRVADGLLRPIHRGVYALGPVTSRGRWMAAVLALGPGAVLSHRAAAALHGLPAANRSTIDVIIPRRTRPRRGIAAHRARDLHASDRIRLDGIPVTSIPRTLLDLAEILSPTQLQRTYEAAERLRVLDVRAVEKLLERSYGRAGIGALRSLLSYDPAPAAEARSELEVRFLDLVREAGMPLPHVNVLVEGFLVDAYWPSPGVVVELQGYAHHSGREAFERDHARLARLKLAGYEVLALTWRQVTMEPAWVAGAIRALLGRPATVRRSMGDAHARGRRADR